MKFPWRALLLLCFASLLNGTCAGQVPMRPELPDCANAFVTVKRDFLAAFALQNDFPAQSQALVQGIMRELAEAPAKCAQAREEWLDRLRTLNSGLSE